MPSDPVRLGVVGLGTMGTLHAGNAVDLGHEVVGGADVDGDARDAFAGAFDASVSASHEELFDTVDLDAVVVATPNATHAPVAVEALDRGLDVLCEKPLAHDLPAAERIADAATESEGCCMTGFHSRFTPAAELFTAYRDADRFGDITHVEVDYVRRRGIPGVGSWFTDADQAGGGALIDIGVHAIDFALYLAGFPPVEAVSGVTRSEFGHRDDYADPEGFGDVWETSGETFDVDDSASAFLRCAGGLTVSLEVAWASNREPAKTVLVRGTEAGAAMELGGGSLTLYETRSVGADHHADATLEGSLEPSGHAAELERFLEAAAAGEDPETNTVSEGVAVQRVVDAIYRSSESGETVAP